MSMNEPNLDDLLLAIPSKFSLVTLAMKRARQIQAGSRPLIDTYSLKPVTIALQEILAGGVRQGPQLGSDELEAQEQAAMLRAIGLSEPTSVSVARRMEEIYGAEEESETEYDEYGEEFEEEEEEAHDEAEEEGDKELLQSDEDDDELGSTSRRATDFMHDDGELAHDIEPDDEIGLEIDVEEDDDASDDDGEEQESGELLPVEGDGAERSGGAGRAQKPEVSAADPSAPRPTRVKKTDEEPVSESPRRGRKSKE